MATNAPSRFVTPNLCACLRAAAVLLFAGLLGSGCTTGLGQGTTTRLLGHSVTLSWDAGPSAVSGYVVYRSTADPVGPFVRLAFLPPSATNYTDASVAAGKTYYYMVSSFDSSNLESLPTDPVTATVPGP